MRTNDRIAADGIIGNFMLEVRRSAIVNKRMLLIMLACIFGAYIVSGILLGINHAGGGKDEICLYSVYMILFGTVGASMIFSDLKQKEQRIDHIMVPASESSKFIIRWIFAVPVLFALLIAAFYVGDWSRMLAFMVTDANHADYPNYFHSPNPWSFWSLGYGMRDNFGPIVFCMAIGSYFMNQSFYFLGAVMWPKFSFGKTLVAVLALQMLFGLIQSIFFKHFGLTIIYDESRAMSIMWSIFGVMVLLTIVCYVLAYIRYRRTQVVYHIFG